MKEKKYSRGWGGLEGILLAGVLVLVFFPLFSSIVNKIHIRFLLHKYAEVVDMAASAVVFQLQTATLSDRSIVIRDHGMLAGLIREIISERLREQDEMGEVEVLLLEPGNICPEGKTSLHPFIHILANIHLHTRGRETKTVPVRIHTDLEIPFGW